MAIERIAGWALALAGAVDVCAYMATPVSLARPLSAYLAAMVVFAIIVTVLSLWSKSRSAEGNGDLEYESVPETGAPRRGLALLLALAWILAGALGKYLWDDTSWNKSPVAAALLIALYMAVLPLLKSSNRRKASRCTRNGKRRPPAPVYGGF
jgi:hypothetical protein